RGRRARTELTFQVAMVGINTGRQLQRRNGC
ncbi:MAG: hypothetical protein ACI9MJ_000440, partial [Alphaproteobacteria bacterium]